MLTDKSNMKTKEINEPFEIKVLDKSKLGKASLKNGYISGKFPRGAVKKIPTS